MFLSPTFSGDDVGYRELVVASEEAVLRKADWRVLGPSDPSTAAEA